MGFNILIYVSLFFALACNKQEQFAPKERTQSYTNSAFATYKTTNCASHGTQLETADILFLYDISSSVTYNTGLIQSMLDAAGIGSQYYNFRIMFAPIQSSSLTGFPVMTNSAQGMGSSVNIVGAPPSLGGLAMGGHEDALLRASQIVNANRTGNHLVFRNNVDHLFVFVVSNGDNNAHIAIQNNNVDQIQTATNFNTRLNNIKSLVTGPLHARKLRFLSFVPHSVCHTGAKIGEWYKRASASLYSFSQSSDQVGNPTPDSFDICTMDTKDIFATANAIANPILIPWHYNKVGISPTANFNPNQVKMWKSLSSGTMQELTAGPANDFVVDSNAQTNVSLCTSTNNTYPCLDTYNGFVAHLSPTTTYPNISGNGVYSYPECVIVQTQPQDIFYGYGFVAVRPNPSTIEVKINNVLIPENAVNGWTYTDTTHHVNENIRIVSPTNRSPATPAVLKTGYFINLNGTAVPKNDDHLEINYLPAL